MEGKRVIQPEAGRETRRRLPLVGIIAAVLAALLLGAALGLCLYASRYEGIFPGVFVGEVDLGGLDRETAQGILSAKIHDLTDTYTITITADGQDLGTYAPSQLGGATNAQELTDQAFAVGRSGGAAGFFRNGLTMVRGMLGSETVLTPAVTYDQGALSAAVEEIAAGFDRAPLDASWELSREGLFATKHQDGRALDQEALTAAILASTGGEIEAKWSTLPAQPLDLEAMAAQLSAEATPARYDVETSQVVDGTVGVTLDLEAARAMVEEELTARLKELIGEDGTVEGTQFTSRVAGGLLQVTLTAECREEIGRETEGWTEETGEEVES